MGRFGQAPIGSLPTRSNRIWVSAARPRPTDQRKDTRSLIRRGQTCSDSNTIMLTIVTVAHAAGDAVGAEQSLVVFAGIGTALIGMMKQARLRTAPLQGHLARADRQIAVVHGADGPAHDKAGVEVEDGCQVQLGAGADHELGGVADPALIRPRGRELPVQHVPRDWLIGVADGRDLEALAHPRLQAFGLHEADDPFATNGDALLDQIFVHARAAVGPAAHLMRRTNQDPQRLVSLGVSRGRPPLPRA